MDSVMDLPHRLLIFSSDGASYVGSVVVVALLLITYLIGNVFYTLTIHPLAGYPGPRWAAVSRIPWWIHAISGNQIRWMLELHSKYGSVVRFSPNDLSYVDHSGNAWKAVHSHVKGVKELPKAKEWFVDTYNGVRGMSNYLEVEQHRRLRRIFSPAFSDRALKAQEPLFQRHVDLLVSKLSEVASLGQPVNMVDMYQFTTFDTMGDLTFGQPLGLLQNGKYSEWVRHVFDAIKVIPIAQLIQYYPLVNSVFKRFEPKFVTDMKYNHFKHSADRVDLRLKTGSDQPDIWNLVLAAQESERLSLEEMYTNAEVFILSGSETTGTSLSGLTYFLLTHPEAYRKLVAEVRESFSSSQDITFDNTAGLRYLNACIQEAIRLYPPVPAGVPRVVPPEGRQMLGKWVPGGTRVSVHHWSTYRSAANYHEPNSFVPERWLGGDARYQDDRRESYQPFGYGSRVCVGQNMAMHEMRLVAAKVLYNFDLSFCAENAGAPWTDQKAYVLWEKKPLLCCIKARQ